MIGIIVLSSIMLGYVFGYLLGYRDGKNDTVRAYSGPMQTLEEKLEVEG